MKLYRTNIALILTALLSVSVSSKAQTTDGRWFAGVQGGTAIGQCTFRSITEHKTRLGLQGGIFGGYHINRVLAAEAGITIGHQTQGACDCCPYWLSASGERHYAPVIDQQGAFYADLKAKTAWQRLSLQLDVDLLKLVNRKAQRWSVTLAPQLAAVHTKTTLKAADSDMDTPWASASQWHLGLGGQLAGGYRVSACIGVQLYAGITCMTGSRYDLIPKHGHKSNLIYDGGIRLTYHFSKQRHEK